MSAPGIRFPAAFLAAAAAGPLFVLSYAAAELYLRIPQPVILRSEELIQFLAFLPPALLVGGVIGLVPIFLAAAVMGALANRWEGARSPLAWAAAGAASGVALTLIFAGADDHSAGFALVTTSIVCAAICRHGVSQ